MGSEPGNGLASDISSNHRHDGLGSELRFNRGDVIFHQGDPPDGLYCIEAGRVSLSVTSNSGKEATVDVLEPCQWFGVQVLLGNCPRAVTATALARTEVAFFKVCDLRQFLNRHPNLAVSLTASALTRLERYEQALCGQLLEYAEHRLATVLLQLAEQGTTTPTGAVIRKVTQEQLAGMVGATRSRVNHFMTRFRRLGYIDYRGGCITVQPELKNILVLGRGAR